MKATLIALSLFVASIAAAQQHDPAPSEGLKNIDFITGDWSGEQNFNNPSGPKTVAKVTAKIHVAVSGHYIEESLTTSIEGRKPADVRHFLAFDPKANAYKVWWFNDTHIGPMELDGSLNGNTLVLQTPPSDAGGPIFRATYEKTSDTNLTYKLEMQRGADWMELFHSNYHKDR